MDFLSHTVKFCIKMKTDIVYKKHLLAMYKYNNGIFQLYEQ